MHRRADLRIELPQKMILADEELLRQLVQRQGLAVVLVNVVQHRVHDLVKMTYRLARSMKKKDTQFITALPAAEVAPAAGQGSAAAAEVLVQGIADLVLVFDEHAEILDYKTDRSRDAQYYIDEYAAQLRLYRRAFAQRLAVPVTKLTIYSFAIEDEIDVPLA